MILQLFLQLVPVFIMGVIAYLTYCISISFKGAGKGKHMDLSCFLVRTPALDAFLMFVIQAVLVAAVEVCASVNISGHTIISLDIIYFFSILILIAYHIMENSASPHLKEA